ncbi:putative tyrosine-protein kinase Wsck [Dissostichus eleginoides]|uniref:Tyrosine-protein kinase Wsck n=1 Tax=Dissostichus eleginoides TaxID=100907 RepID=A0AAD9B6P3_DISEL|nr:putative tyrosine-protein kinase Wsck [Dissostichus eleginoides]
MCSAPDVPRRSLISPMLSPESVIAPRLEEIAQKSPRNRPEIAQNTLPTLPESLLLLCRETVKCWGGGRGHAYTVGAQQVISEELPVGEILERWPALKMESQICAEFHRITNINLKNHFYAELDRHTPRLQRIFRKKAACKGKVAEVLDQLFISYDLQEQGDVHVRRAAVLRALPAYLHEDDSTFLRLWHVEQSDDPNIEDIAVGLVMISARSTDAAVVIEGNRVIELPTLAEAFILLFALTFALHLSYPKDLANTFDFTQKVLMGLDEGNLKPRVLSLKNELLAV